MEIIQSRSNPLIIECVKLRDRAYRKEKGLFFFEGRKLFDEAIARGVEFFAILTSEKAAGYVIEKAPKPDQARLVQVSGSVMEKISEEKSPDGIFCVAKTIDICHDFATIYNNRNIEGRKLVLSSIRDPGNLGTIIRSAAALGVKELIISSDCADLYNSKTVRATMGALFSQKISIVDDLPSSIKYLNSLGYKTYAAVLREGAIKVNELTIDPFTCFVVGNEGHGLDDGVIDACSGSCIIPMEKGAESLNAAIAASLFIWEGYRREIGG